VSGYPDQRSWKNVGTANTHKKKKSKEKRNEIQSPQKDLLLMTSWDPFSVPSTSKVHPMRRDKDRYEISTKRTLAIRKRRPRNVNLGICYLPSTSQTSQSDVFCASMGLQCAIWAVHCLETVVQHNFTNFPDKGSKWTIDALLYCCPYINRFFRALHDCIFVFQKRRFFLISNSLFPP
jgi:hypothetical protein